MKDRICPIDGKPCEKDCPDRYRDTPEGGCLLTTLLDQGGRIVMKDDAGNVAIMM